MPKSLDERLNDVWSSVSNTLNNLWWVVKTFDDHAIIYYNGKHYKANYNYNENDELVLAKQSDWTEVQEGWVAKAMQTDAGVFLEKASSWKVGASRGMPMKKTSSWDGAAAKARIFSWAGWPDNPSPSKAKRAFLIYDSANAENKGAYKDPIADVVDGKLVVVTAALSAAASRLPQTNAPSAVISRAQSVLESYQKRAEKLSKSEDGAFLEEDLEEQSENDFTLSIDVLAKSDKQQITYSVVYEPNTVDAQGDVMTEEEIEKMAHYYLKSHLLEVKPATDYQHQEELDLSKAIPVETYIAPQELNINNTIIKKGSWIVAIHVPDSEIWQKIEKGEIKGYSLRGSGMRVPTE